MVVINPKTFIELTSQRRSTIFLTITTLHIYSAQYVGSRIISTQLNKFTEECDRIRDVYIA